jgi:ATP-dependent DNA helicase RecG
MESIIKNRMYPFENLFRILSHELKLGCGDTSVIGGLEGFLDSWAQKIMTQGDPPNGEYVRELVDCMRGYSKAAPADRKVMIGSALERIRALGGVRPPRGRIPSSAPNGERKASRPRSVHTAAGRRTAEGTVGGGDFASERAASELPTPTRRVATEGHAAGLTPAPVREFGLGLDADVARLENIGPAHARRLQNLGVRTVQDLLYLFPRRYDDYSRLKKISQLMYGEEATIIARVSVVNTREVRGNLHITNVLLADQTGSINATFYRQPFLAKRLRPGTQIVVSGRVERDLNRLGFKHPEWEPLTKELIHTARIVPVYPLTEGLNARWLRKMIRGVVEYWSGKVPDILPRDIKLRAELMDLDEALREIHFPSEWEKQVQAQRRLAFEEFLLIQIGVLRQRRQWREVPGRVLEWPPEFAERFASHLPFMLTGAQQRAMQEILEDIQKPVPMSRLLQGDVGSGKTVVATAAMLVAAANGAQAVLMAPTEILAQQHFKTIRAILDRLGGEFGKSPRVELLIGSMRPREKSDVQTGIASGEVNMAIGTHALIQETVNFQNLAFAVIDEQHRFGVAQRSALRQKGYTPHTLVMSATPIPRTLALTVYGDLDLSILDEMPPGRRQIRTKWLEPRERERAYAYIRKQVEEGRQAFVICPLIEVSEVIDARAAVEEYERLSNEVYPDLRVGLIHGKLKAGEKDEVMNAFRDHKTDVLVATSVVEVGIDVPNATIMLVEGADRFGLAQLHQFRGRVGRGGYQSYCMLLAEKSGTASDERLKVIEETQDGFRLAEQDLILRGPGEFFGTRQSGLPDLKVAKLSDVKLLEEARKVAQDIFEQDPDLSATEHQLLKQKVLDFWGRESWLSG